jgi:hypothetical protein
VKVKSTANKPKVHRVLKIRSSSESDGNPTLQTDASKENVVNQDPPANTAGKEVDGSKDNPTPQQENLVNDQPITEEEKQDDANPNEGAPAGDKATNTNTGPEVEGEEVKIYSTLNLRLLY